MTQGKKAEDETALTGWNHGYYSDKLKGVSLIRLAEQPIGLISLIDLLYTLNRPEATYKGWLMPTVQDTLQQPGCALCWTLLDRGGFFALNRTENISILKGAICEITDCWVSMPSQIPMHWVGGRPTPAQTQSIRGIQEWDAKINLLQNRFLHLSLPQSYWQNNKKEGWLWHCTVVLLYNRCVEGCRYFCYMYPLNHLLIFWVVVVCVDTQINCPSTYKIHMQALND